MVGRVRSPTVPKRIWALTLGWLGMGSANQGAQLINISSVLSSANHDTVWMYSSGIKAVLCCWMLNSIIELDSGYARVRYIYICPWVRPISCSMSLSLLFEVMDRKRRRFPSAENWFLPRYLRVNWYVDHWPAPTGRDWQCNPHACRSFDTETFLPCLHLQLYMTPIWEEDLTAA